MARITCPSFIERGSRKHLGGCTHYCSLTPTLIHKGAQCPEEYTRSLVPEHNSVEIPGTESRVLSFFHLLPSRKKRKVLRESRVVFHGECSLDSPTLPPFPWRFNRQLPRSQLQFLPFTDWNLSPVLITSVATPTTPHFPSCDAESSTSYELCKLFSRFVHILYVAMSTISARP